MPITHKKPGTLRLRRINTAILLVGGLLMSAMASAQTSQPRSSTNAEPSADDTRPLGRVDDELGDVWINDVGILLDIDRDRDGWFSRFVVSIDADVDQRDNRGRQFASEARVFVRLSLTDSSGIESLLYDSDRFDIYGISSSDRHRIELDLRDAFPEDRYDMVVELRDAYNDQLLDVVDAQDFRTLNDLPLEDAQRDGRIANDGTGDNVVAVEYAGGSGPLLLLLGVLGLAWRNRSTRART